VNGGMPSVSGVDHYAIIMKLLDFILTYLECSYVGGDSYILTQGFFFHNVAYTRYNMVGHRVGGLHLPSGVGFNCYSTVQKQDCLIYCDRSSLWTIVFC
jgi:hypothetical protein